MEDVFIEEIKCGRGCGYGHVNRGEIENMKLSLGDFKKTLDQINNRLFGGIILVIILAFFAGVNSFNAFISFATKWGIK